MSSGGQSAGARIRWRWVVACLVSGVLLVGAAWLVEARWAWEGVTPSVLIELGMAFGLAGVLYLLEQIFEGKLLQATREEVRQAERRFQQTADEISSRLDDLQGEVDARVRQAASEQDRTISGLDTDVSFKTVTGVLAEANRLGAVHRGRVIVQASADPDGMSLIFFWGTTRNHPRGESTPHLDIEVRDETDSPSPPQVRLVSGSDPGPSGSGVDRTVGGRPHIQVEWEPQQSAADVGQVLVENLQRNDMWRGEGTLDWGLAIRNLQRSVKVAIASRRRDPGEWHLGGTLIELVGDDWAITTAAVECPPRDYRLPESDFPQRTADRSRRPVEALGPNPLNTWQPERPDWADPDEWARVVRRAKRYFPFPLGVPVALLSDHWIPSHEPG